MLELLIVILLLYVSYKLKKQDKLIREQNRFIKSLHEMQEDCNHRVNRLEKSVDNTLKSIL